MGVFRVDRSGKSVRTRQMVLKRVYAMDMYRCLSQLISRCNQLQAHIALVQETIASYGTWDSEERLYQHNVEQVHELECE